MERSKRRQPDKRLARKNRHYNKTQIGLVEDIAALPYSTPEILAKLNGKKAKDWTTRILAPLCADGLLRHHGEDDDLPKHWPDFYITTEKADELLYEHGTKPFQIIRHYRKLTDTSHVNFKHDFPATNVIASMEIEANALGYPVRRWTDILANAGPNPSMKIPCTINYRPKRGERVYFDDYMVNDGMIAISFSPGSWSNFTIEHERGNPIEPTMDLKRASLLKKSIALKDIHKRAAWTKYEKSLPIGQRPLRGYRKQLNITNMRTLFISKSEARMNTMVETALSITGPTNLLLFTHLDTLHKKPYENLLSREWHRPGMEPTTLMPKQKETPA
jgi:hypothetical protein